MRVLFAFLGLLSMLTACASNPSTQVSSPASAVIAPTQVTTTVTVSESRGGWHRIVYEAQDAVVRVEVVECHSEERYLGSGFVVADDLVMTAAHVVSTASSVSVQVSGQDPVEAQVLAWDFDADTAILRLVSPVSVTPLSFANADPVRGESLLILGYPLGAHSMSVTDGIVSDLDQRVEYDYFAVDPVFTTNAPTNGGNSGGPVLDENGDVLGLVSGRRDWVMNGESVELVTGINYVVPADEIRRRLARWRDLSRPIQLSCEPEESEAYVAVEFDDHSESAHDLAAVLQAHGEAINRGDYTVAYSMFTAPFQKRMGSSEQWGAGLQSSVWSTLRVKQATVDGDTAVASVDLTTHQDPADSKLGLSCQVLHLHYDFKEADGSWLIDNVDETTPVGAC